MGTTWELQLWGLMDFPDGSQDWGWQTFERTNSTLRMIKSARAKRRENVKAIRVIWR